MPKQRFNKATSSSSKSVKRLTLYRSGSRSVHIGFRVPMVVRDVLRGCVPNVSVFLRRLVLDALEKLPVHGEFEELRLELKVACLEDELGKLHRWGSLLLKHGSYAKAYLDEVKGGVVFDRKPYYYSRPPRRPPAKPEEIVTVSDLVELREKLSMELNRVLRRLVELKRARYSRQSSQSRDTSPHGDPSTKIKEE